MTADTSLLTTTYRTQTQMANANMQNVASMLPEDMISAGLIDDFDGTITRARLKPWDYQGKLDHHVLAAELTIVTDDGDTVTQIYTAGDLQHFVPSKDGINPVDLENGDGEELEGVYVYKVGKRAQLANSSNWYLFLSSALEAGLPREILASSNVSDLEGVKGHWNRLAQPTRSGLKVQQASGDGKAREKQYLALTEYQGKVAVAGAGKAQGGKAVAGGAKAASSAPANDELNAKVAEVILNAVAEAGDAGVQRKSLTSVIIKAFAGGPERAGAVKLIGDNAFLGSIEGTSYDATTGVLTLA